MYLLKLDSNGEKPNLSGLSKKGNRLTFNLKVHVFVYDSKHS
jgi:hypothetical protein